MHVKKQAVKQNIFIYICVYLLIHMCTPHTHENNVFYKKKTLKKEDEMENSLIIIAINNRD